MGAAPSPEIGYEYGQGPHVRATGCPFLSFDVFQRLSTSFDAMPDRSKLDQHAILAQLPAAKGWAYDGTSLRKAFTFADYGAGIAFVVRIALASEKRDHHPDLQVGYRRVDVCWSTHDAGGVTVLDVEMAMQTDALVGPAA
jgi:4a-hydroxytetrahydrobiopterin dehydratase